MPDTSALTYYSVVRTTAQASPEVIAKVSHWSDTNTRGINPTPLVERKTIWQHLRSECLDAQG